MKKPSCGFSNIGAFAVFSTSLKWSKANITYSVLNYTSDMNSSEVDDTLKKVFSMWSNVSCLNFTQVPKDADIAMTFYLEGQKTPFMEEVLGYAYGPGKGAGGDVFLNEAVIWTNDNDKILAENATSLRLAAAHEVGHALGLAHSSRRGAVMYGDYTPKEYEYGKYKSTNVPYFESLMLHQDDIDGIQYLYVIFLGRVGEQRGQTTQDQEPL
uniref:Uncharacterized protein n=1 Tax=Sphaerodactylus townsendi TaxID=933632 RepID=A0ACB8FH16_9SAUR